MGKHCVLAYPHRTYTESTTPEKKKKEKKKKLLHVFFLHGKNTVCWRTLIVRIQKVLPLKKKKKKKYSHHCEK